MNAELLSEKEQLENAKNRLTDTILEAFQNPDKWPMTDSERISLLRNLYKQTQWIHNFSNSQNQ